MELVTEHREGKDTPTYKTNHTALCEQDTRGKLNLKTPFTGAAKKHKVCGNEFNKKICKTSTPKTPKNAAAKRNESSK